ncbi:MAG: hypothetical protein RL596_1616 [Bacteroidota bacterium]
MKNNCLTLLSILFITCTSVKKQPSISTEEVQHQCVQKLTDVIVYDIFTPPVASRIYAYSNLAYYEALIGNTDSNSIVSKLKGFDPLNRTTISINPTIAAATAFMKVAEALVFSKDSIKKYSDHILAGIVEEDNKKILASKAWGEAVATMILKRAAADNYKKTRGMPRYSVFKEATTWQQTPPDYVDAVEPNWRLIKPLLMDSSSQFAPPPPPSFSVIPSSLYQQELMEVYNISKHLSPEQDSIAAYWDDNPFVTMHTGHLTYANKKTTPVGHWMGIIAITSRIQKANTKNIAKAYALASAAIFDGFISCWDEKFRSKTKRPITVIREYIESEWSPNLQTPPFPEYTSGHSVISAAAATVLTKQLGSNIVFTDTTELQYLGMKRTFHSFKAAADEAGISRLYGGIHYTSAIEQGKLQGIKVGELYTQRFIY